MYLKINIKLVDNFYSVGWERTLVKKITGKDYDKVPSEVGVIVNNISTIYAIYEALKYNKPLIERFITFSGENIGDKRNVLVKIGTDAKEILKEFNLKEDSLIITGGPMMGTKVDDLVISANLNCVLALNKNVEQPSICLKCGKCVEACPAKLSPVLIMNGKEKNLRKLHPEKCIGCGLCSYVCPAKLLVREKVKEAKNKVRGDK